ncbi:MAG: N-6 DNA methylase, partial [Bacilli bacterium]|nr:N-6 DNA methylase [Bacilli bacterium]
MDEKFNAQRFFKVAAQYGDFDDSLPAYVSLLYLDFLNKNHSDRDDLDLGKKAESIAKSYYQRFSGSSFARLQTQVADLDLSQSDFRSVLSFLLSGAMSHFEASASSSVEMARLVSGLLGIRPGEVVLDFGSGNGSFLVSVEENLPKASVKPTLIGIEPNANDALISQMALSMIGSHFEIQNRDGFSGDVPKFDKGYVFPPEGLAYNKGLLKGAEYINRISPKSSMEWAFVLRALESMSPKGKLVALLPESCLFRESDLKIREKLIEDGLIEGIISFPPKSMIGTFRKMNLVVFSKGNSSVRVIDGQDLFKTVD